MTIWHVLKSPQFRPRQNQKYIYCGFGIFIQLLRKKKSQYFSANYHNCFWTFVFIVMQPNTHTSISCKWQGIWQNNCDIVNTIVIPIKAQQINCNLCKWTHALNNLIYMLKSMQIIVLPCIVMPLLILDFLKSKCALF